jgi:hypothetical protein
MKHKHNMQLQRSDWQQWAWNHFEVTNASTPSSLKSYAELQKHVTSNKLIFVLLTATEEALFIARMLTVKRVTLLLHSK